MPCFPISCHELHASNDLVKGGTWRPRPMIKHLEQGVSAAYVSQGWVRFNGEMLNRPIIYPHRIALGAVPEAQLMPVEKWTKRFAEIAVPVGKEKKLFGS